MRYTIEDLKNRKVAVVNDGTLQQLKEVLKLAFPDDVCYYDIKGNFKYYFAYDENEFYYDDDTDLPSQSVEYFLVNDDCELPVRWYSVLERLPDERFHLKKVVVKNSLGTIFSIWWDNEIGGFTFNNNGDSDHLYEGIVKWLPVVDEDDN